MKFENCPICGKELLHREEKGGSVYCNNNCYETEEWVGFTNHCFFSIGNEKAKISFYNNDKDYERKVVMVNKIIASWKENDRYLAKIMSIET